jgi:rhodanese-related sulfurtransferase
MKHTIFVVAILLGLFSLAHAEDVTQSSASIPAEAQTSLGLYATAQEAYDRWKANPDAVKILDVRTPDEYVFVGHAEMAWNVPVKLQTYQWDPSGKKLVMKDNPDFITQVKALFKPDDTVFVMCRSGGRSAMAVNAMAKAGYTQAINIVEGMEGDLVEDPSSPDHGKRLKNGWKNAGLPWTYALDPLKMSLPAK